MSHGFFTHAGFLIDGAPGSARAPFREEHMLVEGAAHECSLDPRCRGFTYSVTHMQDDRLHFVRFFSHNHVAISGEWVSHLKEPTHAHAYQFVPGFLLPAPRRGARRARGRSSTTSAASPARCRCSTRRRASAAAAARRGPDRASTECSGQRLSQVSCAPNTFTSFLCSRSRTASLKSRTRTP